MSKINWSLAGLLSVMVSLSLIFWSNQAQSQEKYPSRAISILVPFAAGGSQDLTARVVADFLKRKWSVPVNVVNKPGGNTVPHAVELYNSATDGYTVSFDQDGSNALLQVLGNNLPFKVMDRTFIGSMAQVPNIFMVPANSPYKSLKDAAEDAKKNPGSFTWSSLGGMSAPDLNVRLFFKAAEIDASKTKPVMCKGGSEAAILVAGGHVKIGSTSIIGARPGIQAGTIRLFALPGKRNPDFPDVPTTAEQGFPTVNFISRYFFSGPPKLGSHIVDIWSNSLKEISKDPEYISRLNKMDVIPFYSDGLETKENMLNKIEMVTAVYGSKK